MHDRQRVFLSSTEISQFLQIPQPFCEWYIYLQMPKPPREIAAFPVQVGVSKLRKKLRDLTRVLKKNQFDATKKAATERAIEAVKAELNDLVKNKKVRELARRYHMVRFFERKKAMRRLRRVVKEEPDNKEKLQIAEAGWYYVNQFPIEKKYVAIFVNEKAEKPDFFKEILDQVKKGELPSGIENDDSVAFQKFPIDKTNISRSGFMVNGETKIFLDDVVEEEKKASNVDESGESEESEGESKKKEEKEDSMDQDKSESEKDSEDKRLESTQPKKEEKASRKTKAKKEERQLQEKLASTRKERQQKKWEQKERKMKWARAKKAAEKAAKKSSSWV